MFECCMIDYWTVVALLHIHLCAEWKLIEGYSEMK